MTNPPHPNPNEDAPQPGQERSGGGADQSTARANAPGGNQPPGSPNPPPQGRNQRSGRGTAQHPGQVSPARRDDATHAAAMAAEQAARAAQQAAQQVSVLVQQVSVLVQQMTRANTPPASQRTTGPVVSPTASAGSQTPQRAQGSHRAPPGTGSPGGPIQQPDAHQPPQPPASPGQRSDVATPDVDVYDAPDELTVFCDLPGVRAEDIQLEGDEHRLRIAADRTPAGIEAERSPTRRERHRRAERTVQLPAAVIVEQAEATCEHGVCRVRLPKASRRSIGVH